MTGLLLFTITSAAIAALLMIMFVIMSYRQGQSDPFAVLEQEFSGPSLQRMMSRFYQKFYVFLMDTKLLRRYLLRIRRRVEYLHVYDEYKLRLESAKIAFWALTSTVLAMIILLIIHKGLIYTVWVIFGVTILNNIVTDFFIHRVEDKLLHQLTILFEDVRHYYQQHKMVDEAIYDAMAVAPYEASLHANRVYGILTSDDVEKSLESYDDSVSNKYLKAFAGISHLVMEYGDRMTEKGSMYLQALSKLVQEINLERIRKEQLQYRLQGLVAIAILPLVFLKPIEDWAINYFPIMAEFYEGKIGILTKVFILALVYLSYTLIKRMAQDETLTVVSRKRRERLSHKWPRLVLASPFGQKIIDKTCPKPKTNQHHRLTMLLKDTNSSLTVEWFHINRLTLALMGLLTTILLFVGLHFMAIYSILNKPTDLDLSLGQPTEEKLAESQELTRFDKEVIKRFQGTLPTVEDIAEHLMATHGEDRNVTEIIEDADRIHNKITRIENEVFKWWELLLGFAVATILYYMPLWMLMFQRSVRKMEMQGEVDEFHVLISILSQFERMNVEMILEWMEKFAVIFKAPIQTCLINYDAGAEEALEQLKKDASFPSFVRIVEKLQLAVERIPIKDAFDDLESEMEYYREQRKLHYEKVIETKAIWGTWLGFAPSFAVVFLYLVIPLLLASTWQMQEYILKLQGL